MNKIKLTAIVMACTLSLSILSGCKNGKSGEGAAANGKSGTEQVGELKLPLSDKLVTFRYLIGERADAAVKNDWPIMKEIEKKTNVHIEFEAVPAAGMEEKKKILIATNSLPDIANVSPKDGRKFGPDGALLDLKDLIDKYAPNIKKLMAKYPEAKVVSTATDGGMYSVPVFGRDGFYSNSWLIRKDIVDQYSLKYPTNPEEFATFLKALKDKNPKSYPFTARLKPRDFVNLFTGIYTGVDGVLGFNPTKEKYEFAASNTKFKDMLVYLNKMNKDGLLDPEFSVLQANQWEERLLTGKSFVTWDNRTRPDQFTAKAQAADKNTAYNMDFMPMFAVSGVKPFQYSNAVVMDYSGVALSSKIKEKEIAIRYIDYLYSEEGLDFTTFGVLGQSYDMVNGKPEVKATLGADPAPALRRDYGALYDGLWYNQYKYSPKRSQKFLDGEKIYQPFILNPPKPIIDTEKELERKKEIQVNLDKYMDQELIKFIMGNNPINDDTLNNFLKECKKLGAEEYVTMVNQQYEKAYGKK